MITPATIVREVEIHVVASGQQGPPGPAGEGGGRTLEVISVYNNGDPQIVFTKTGDTVTNDVT